MTSYDSLLVCIIICFFLASSNSYQISEALRQNRFLCSKSEEEFCSIIKSAVDEGNINGRDKFGKTLTYIAAENGYLEGLRLLLELEANLNITDVYGTSPLHAAVKNDHIDAIKSLSHHLIDLNLKDIDNEAALHLAVRNENYRCVKVLLMYGANPNIKGPNNLTPLHIAAMINKIEKSGSIINELIKYDAEIDAVDDNGKTPLWYAARAGNENGVKALIAKKALINQDIMWETVDKGHLKILKILVVNNGNINSRGGWSNSTLLVCAVTHDNFDIAKFLLDSDVDINDRFGQGFTALHRAVMLESIKCVKLLLFRKSDVNAKDDNGRTPLDYCNNLDIYDMLIERGAKHGFLIRKIVTSEKNSM